MYCRKCGEQLKTDDKFCPKCGFSVTGHLSNDDIFNAAPKPKDIPLTKRQRTFKTLDLIFFILSIASIFIGSQIYIVVLHKSDPLDILNYIQKLSVYAFSLIFPILSIIIGIFSTKEKVKATKCFIVGGIMTFIIGCISLLSFIAAPIKNNLSDNPNQILDQYAALTKIDLPNVRSSIYGAVIEDSNNTSGSKGVVVTHLSFVHVQFTDESEIQEFETAIQNNTNHWSKEKESDVVGSWNFIFDYVGSYTTNIIDGNGNAKSDTVIYIYNSNSNSMFAIHITEVDTDYEGSGNLI